MKSTLRACCLFLTSAGAAFLVFAQGVPGSQWTEKEQQFVQEARTLYQRQGIAYSDTQAAAAVQQMRQQQGSAPTGIPESQWTSQERGFVEMARKQYSAQGVAFTQAQAEQSVLAMREQIAKMTGIAAAFQMAQGGVAGASTPAHSQNPATTPEAGVSETHLAALIAAWPAKPADIRIVERRDGFDLNGRPVIDPEGKMTSYAVDVIAGEVTYAVRSARGLTIKTLSAADPSRVVVIAQGSQTSAGWEFVTATGQRLSGDTFSVLSNGFLIGRGSAAFRYQTGRGVSAISIPDGYLLAPLQRGNVGATGFLLLEREMAGRSADPVKSLVGSLQTIGAILGATTKEDYALLNVKSGKTHPLNISAHGKDTTVYAQCRKVNWLVSNCQKYLTFESLYGADGHKNNSHYYWLVNWASTPSGPVAVALEGGLSDLYVIDLESGRKVLAFQRSLGIANWSMTQSGNGHVAIDAQLAFEKKNVPDVAELLRTN